MRKAFLFVTAALFALGMTTASGAQVPNAGTNDYSSGFGFLEDPQTRGSVGYEVIGLTPGGAGVSPAQGEFDFRRQTNGRGFHASAVCIRADGNRAVLGLEVEQSTDPAYRPGELVEAVAVDNVDGNGGDRRGDTFDLDESSSNEADCMEDGQSNEDSPIRGDIVVEDAGFATLPQQ